MSLSLLVGSKALVYHFPELETHRIPKDTDFFVQASFDTHNYTPIGGVNNKYFREDEVEGIIEIEKEYSTDCSLSILFNGIFLDKHFYGLTSLNEIDYKKEGLIASPHLLYTIKMSHRYLKNSPFFWKTLGDILFLRSMGIDQVPIALEHFLSVREKETYNYDHPKLNTSKKEFFNDSVPYVYDHDDIHKAVAIDSRPAYTYYIKDNSEVMCDSKAFFTIDEEKRINGVLEECYVLAIERSLVPFPGVLTPTQAFLYAFSKVATSITSGWFREYAYDNALKIIKQYNNNYYDKFIDVVARGLVGSYK